MEDTMKLFDEEFDPLEEGSGSQPQYTAPGATAQPSSSDGIDYWKNMNQPPSGFGGPSGYPAYGTPEWYKYFFGLDPAESQPIIDAQKQGQAEFDAGIFGGPDGAINPDPPPSAASPSDGSGNGDQNSYYSGDQSQTQTGGGGGGNVNLSGSSQVNQTSVSGSAAPIGTNVTGGPNPYTSDPGPQDALLDMLMQRMTQGTNVSVNDPNIRAQADPYAAAIERQRRSYMSDQAERSGAYATGAMRGQDRMTRERAGQSIGMFEADLVGRELEAKRQEIREAMSQLGGIIDSDQQRQLARELANIDAQLKQLGITSQESLGREELALKERLGTAGLNVDLMNLLLGQQRFSDQLGFDIADREAYWNSNALRDLLA